MSLPEKMILFTCAYLSYPRLIVNNFWQKGGEKIVNLITYTYSPVISGAPALGGLRDRGRPRYLCFFSLSLGLPPRHHRFPVNRQFDDKGCPLFPGPLHGD